MHGDLMMLRVACKVVEERTSSDDKQQQPIDPQRDVATSNASAVTMRTACAPTAMLPTPHLLPTVSLEHRLHHHPLPATAMPATTTTSHPYSLNTMATDDKPSVMSLRIPTLAADLMRGLTAHAMHQLRDDASHPHKRARVDMTTRSAMQLPTLASVQRPTLHLPSLRTSPVKREDNDSDRSVARAAPVTLVSFLGHKNKRGEERVPGIVNAEVVTSPTSVWEENAHSDSSCDTASASPVGSPVTSSNVHTSVSVLQVPTIPTRQLPVIAHGNSPPIAGRSHGVPLPPLSLAASSRLPPANATSRPTLVRKKSSQWRHEMPEQDREKTRQRIMRGMHSECNGDYEMLLRIICAMEEEVLHVRTTSTDHYLQQSDALRDRIEAHAAARYPAC